MTRTRPFLTMIRHFSHLLFTDGLTCIRLLLWTGLSPGSLVTEARSVGVGRFVLASGRIPKAPR